MRFVIHSPITESRSHHPGRQPRRRESHNKFAKKFDLPFPLLADQKNKPARPMESGKRRHVRQEVYGRGTNDVRD